MRRLIKRIVCAALLCALFCTAVFAETAEEAPISEPTHAPTEAPTEKPVEAPTSETSSEPTESPAEEPTAQPTEAPKEEPIEQPTTEPSAEPSTAPTESASPEASETPVPSPGASEEPIESPTPEPSPEPESALRITVTGSARAEDGRFVLQYKNPQDVVEISWNAVEGTALYHLKIESGEGTVYEADTEGTVLALTVADLLRALAEENANDAQIRTLRVTALDVEGENLADGSLVLQLVGEGGKDRRRGGFHRGGSGGRGKGGASEEEEQGFRVTPGKALTSTHSTGDQSMNLYGSVEITPSDEPVCALSVGGEDITLDGGSFTAAQEENILTLVPVSEGEAWRFSGKALKTLSRSGIQTLILRLGAESFEIPTALEMRGKAYAKLAAQGIASKDYGFAVGTDDTEVFVSGKRFRLNAEYEMLEIGG